MPDSESHLLSGASVSIVWGVTCLALLLKSQKSILGQPCSQWTAGVLALTKLGGYRYTSTPRHQHCLILILGQVRLDHCSSTHLPLTSLRFHGRTRVDYLIVEMDSILSLLSSCQSKFSKSGIQLPIFTWIISVWLFFPCNLCQSKSRHHNYIIELFPLMWKSMVMNFLMFNNHFVAAAETLIIWSIGWQMIAWLCVTQS